MADGKPPVADGGSVEVAETTTVLHESSHLESAARMHPHPHPQLRGYLVERPLGVGGFGAVHAGFHAPTQRPVAIKMLHPQWTTSLEMVTRLFREAETASMIGHPNIVEIYEAGWLGHVPAIVMELLPGVSLRRVVRDRGPMSPEDAIQCLAPVCDALSAAHARGVIHRDIKGSNVIISDGRVPSVTLIDFGIAKLLSPEVPGLTRTGAQVGTLVAMAPEQILGTPVDARTDVYALGVLTYFVLTGRMPFENSSPHAVEQMHLTALVPRPSQIAPVNLALDRVVKVAMEKAPSARFASVADFLAALRAAASAGMPTLDRTSHPRPVPISDEEDSSAVAIAVELFHDSHRIDCSTLDDEGLDELQASIEAIGEQLHAHGYIRAAQTDTAVIGCKLAVDDAPTLRQAAIDLAPALLQVLAERRSGRFEIVVHIDLGSVRVRRDGATTQLVRSELFQLCEVAPRSNSGVWASRRIVDGLCCAIDDTDGEDRWLRVHSL